MAGIKDVAAYADVSVATVSRVLNGHSGVRDDTRSRVLSAVAELRYRPNTLARSLRTDQTRTLGLVISDVMNPFFTELARAVEDAARSRGYSVIIGNADEQLTLQDHHVRTLLDRRIDGLLVSPADGDSQALREAAVSGIPMVFVDRWVEGLVGLGIPVVRADGRAAVRDLVAHLYELGHRRLAIITGPVASTTSNERVQAFRSALREHGLPLPESYIGQGDFQTESGRRVTNDFFSLPEPPEAVFATDNLMALGVMEQLRVMGLRVPGDVALAAFDDIPWFLHTDPPITAIGQPTQELGHRAVAALTDLVEGASPRTESGGASARTKPGGGSTGSVTLSAHLIARRSCGEDERNRR